jgi:aquaporin Z
MTTHLFRRCLIEAAGTAFLAHAIARASHASFNGFQQALLVGLTLALLIHACGRTSGAHFNPAVTLRRYPVEVREDRSILVDLE